MDPRLFSCQTGIQTGRDGYSQAETIEPDKGQAQASSMVAMVMVFSMRSADLTAQRQRAHLDKKKEREVYFKQILFWTSGKDF